MPKRTFRLSDSRPDAKRDVDDELAFHVEMRTREFIEQGLSPDEARRRALNAFGDMQEIRSGLQAERIGRNRERERAHWWQAFRMDARYGIRTLRQNAAFSLSAIGTLALGIGASLAVFTVVNGVLVRPLPYAEPERISMVWITAPGADGAPPRELPLSSGFFTELERDNRSFEALAAFRSWSHSLVGQDGTREPVAGARVSPALFEALGVAPMLGQPFTDAEAVPGAPRVAVISHSLWRNRFAQDRSIVGKPINLSDESFTVVGVMPPGFTFPRGAELPPAFQFGLRTDVWTPLVFDSTDRRNFGTMNLSAVGRRIATVPEQEAQNDASRIMRAFLQGNAPNAKLDFRLVSMAEQSSRKLRAGLLILMGAVSFLLLIACANVVSLLVARASGRQRELAVRAALGAGRARIARQLVTENLLLAFAGCAAGIAISYGATRAMLAMVPGSLPRADDIAVDWRVMAFAALVALSAGALFGVATAGSVRWSGLAGALHEGGARATSGIRHRYGRRLLVAAEVALSLILLIGASLLTRSFVRLQSIEPGFEVSGVLTAGASLPVAGRFDPARDGARWSATLDRLTAELATSPGVVAAGAVSSLPLSGAFESGELVIPGLPAAGPGERPGAEYSVVSGDYFAAAGIPLVSGRVFDSRDAAPGVRTIVVNREFVRRYMSHVPDPLGLTLGPLFDFSRAERTIVGVVADVKQRTLEDEPTPQVYVPVSQMPYPGLTIVIRTATEPLSAVGTLRRVVASVDATATINDIRTFEEVLEQSLARQRFSMTLISVFAGSALLLAVVGLYGVIALLERQRRREIGVRMALGARPADALRLVLADGWRLTVVGVAAGVLGALALTRVLSGMLYGVSATDAVTFAGAALAVFVVSTGAVLVPAWRAARVDPTLALRQE